MINMNKENGDAAPAQNVRLVFMGTPAFAVASLDALVQEGFEIAGVITAPDKPAGRGLQLQQSAVKTYALENGLRILQPEKLKNPAFIQELKSLNADLQIVVAFRMLPEVVWNMPPLGTIDVHGSLLPQYRGAAPINWAIINGEKETGVTTFKLQHEIDTGAILLHEKITIGENETAGELHDRMKNVGAQVLVKTILDLKNGSLHAIPQPNIQTALKHAPKIDTETCRIDWNKSVYDIYNLIRGLSPYPAAFTTLEEKKLKVFTVEKQTTSPTEPPGTFVTDKKNVLKFACLDGYIIATDIQLEGKKRMSVAEFLRGYRFAS